jgi:hypothetical protein
MIALFLLNSSPDDLAVAFDDLRLRCERQPDLRVEQTMQALSARRQFIQAQSFMTSVKLLNKLHAVRGANAS